MKTISIIGGTGMLGAPVAKQLLTDGFTVRILTRNPEKAQQQLGDDFEYRLADIQDVASLKAAFEGTDFIHINVSGHSKASYYAQHVQGTKNVLKALAGKTVDCISMISSASAHPEFNDRWDNRYKYEAEQLLKASGQPYLAFMPSWFVESLSLLKQNNRVMHIGPSTKLIHWLTAEDYAKVVSQSLQDAHCRNTRMAIYGPEGISMRDAVARFAASQNLKVQTMPAWIASLLGKLTRDETLVDVADLMVHYDKTGEKSMPNTLRTETTLNTWLAQVGASA